MRRRAGIGAIQDRTKAQERFRDKGVEIQENQLEELAKQLDNFKSKLEEFAAKYRKTIKKDPEFREHFQNMCATIGVDPLASSKGFWSELLGMGNFYYEIAVQSVEIILATSHLNGGVMTFGELRTRLNSSRNKNLKTTEISFGDIKRAMKSLNVLGKGCGVIQTGSDDTLEESLVFCVPEELSLDNTTVVQFAAKSGHPFLTSDDLINGLNWTQPRTNSVLERLVCEGIVWIDDHAGRRTYWFPSLFLASKNLQ